MFQLLTNLKNELEFLLGFTCIGIRYDCFKRMNL